MQRSLIPPREAPVPSAPSPPPPKGRCVERVGTASLDWQLDCLARHICRMPTKDARHAFLAEFGKKKPPEFVDDLTQRILMEWGKMYGAPRQAGEADGDSR
jgi:hypothetical protein